MIGKLFLPVLMLIISTAAVGKISDEYMLVSLIGFVMEGDSAATKTEVIKRWLVPKDAFGEGGWLLCQPLMGKHLNNEKTRLAHKKKLVDELENFKMVTNGAEFDANELAKKHMEESISLKLSNIERYQYMVECHTFSQNSEMKDFFDY
ncbi:hypothetical protein [Aeromonas veronii]|uniref:hypothetical protein n=1 Tax=Aeromonas veronii TaxID=654 RepID=UPI002B488892|nr:hypothetical protein [Aeromonas veronii]